MILAGTSQSRSYQIFLEKRKMFCGQPMECFKESDCRAEMQNVGAHYFARNSMLNIYEIENKLLVIDETKEPGYCWINISPKPDRCNSIDEHLDIAEAISLASVDEELLSSNEFKKDIDNTISEKLTSSMLVRMKSVGVLVYEGVRGTVFRVGSKYVLTALHVVTGITNPTKRDSKENDWRKLGDPDVWITFAPSATDLQRNPFYLKPDVIFMSKELDIAILELKPGNALPEKLDLSKDMGRINQVHLVGFGHPFNSEKHWDPNCKVVLAMDDFLNSLHAHHSHFLERSGVRTILQLHGLDTNVLEVNKCYAELLSSDRFACHIAMEHGASGAPAIAENEVVGVLVKGLPLYYYELKRRSPQAHYVQNFPSHLKFELCTRADRMYEVIKKENPRLAKDLFS